MISALALPSFLAQLGPGERTPCYKRSSLFMPANAKISKADCRAAKDLCLMCPVREGCAEHALRTGEPEGIWGGLTPKERKAVAVRRSRRPDCGTEVGWRSHISRREGCTVCREAHEERQRAARLQRLALEHRLHGGSLTAYRLELALGMETCVLCRAARKAYYASRQRTGRWYRRTAA